jgi:hypothetical protein
MNQQARIGLFGGLIVSTCLASSAAADTLLTFEEFVGFDNTNVASFYSGITFETIANGSDWKGRDATTGAYNVSSYPSGPTWGSGQYWIHDSAFATTALDTTGDGGKVSFTSGDATYVELSYSAANTFHLEAYRADGTQIDVDTGPANLRFANSNPSGPGTLRVDWNGTDHIAYVIVHDAGNFWLIDNFQTDAGGITGGTTIIPLPAAAWMGITLLGGVGGAGCVRRRWRTDV